MKTYIYPENLRASVKLWFWSIRDFIIICGEIILSVVILVNFPGWRQKWSTGIAAAAVESFELNGKPVTAADGVTWSLDGDGCRIARSGGCGYPDRSG